jgi:hypothetical protein
MPKTEKHDKRDNEIYNHYKKDLITEKNNKSFIHRR